MIAEFETGEWLRYTLTSAGAGERAVTVVGAGGGRVSVSLNGGRPMALDLPGGDERHEMTTSPLPFLAGTNTLILRAEDCAACRVEGLKVADQPGRRRDDTASSFSTDR